MKPVSIDEYISTFPVEVQEKLQQLRETILKVAPGAVETISYQMPAFKFHGPLVYFAAYKKHIGFYPTPSGIEKIKEQLPGYNYSKGAVQFPLNKPIPYDLVEKIVRIRVEENLRKLV